MKRYLVSVLCSTLLLMGPIATALHGQNPAARAQRNDAGANITPANYVDEDNRLLWAPMPRWIPTAKRVRVYFAGQVVADSTHVHILRDAPVPVYYFPESDVKSGLFVPSKQVRNAPTRGDASFWSIKAGDRIAEDAVWTYRTPIEGSEFLKGYVAFEWNKMDAWFEEMDQVFVHPRDPFLRIDTVSTDRHVKVVLNGQTVAESGRAVMLFEPGQPIRYYLPIADTRVELLRPSDTTSRCPYKGLANYYSVDVGGRVFKDVVWSYRAPTLESGKIAGMVAFYNEQVDAIFVGGEEVPKPGSRRR